MNKNGFTLLESLVVVAIIGVISTIAILNYSQTRSKARDVKRLKELASFAKGLELYYDIYGMYPCGDAVEIAVHNNPGGTFDTSHSVCEDKTLDRKGFLNGFGGDLLDCDGSAIALPPECPNNYAGLFSAGILSSNGYVDPLYKDASRPYWAYTYHVTADRQNFILATYLENDKEKMMNDGGVCDGFYEIGGVVGQIVDGAANPIEPWYEMACECDGNYSNSQCD